MRIIFRGDRGCCRWRMLAWCEQYEVGYLLGLAKNARLHRRAEPHLSRAAPAFTETGQPQRPFAAVD
jgi:hypothetical protein